MRRALPRASGPRFKLLGLAACLSLAFAGPAEAIEFGGWYGRATLDAWHDDNLARQDHPLASLYPRGNQDLGGNVGLALGTAFLFTPEVELWLTGSGRLSRALVYPEWSGASGAFFADLSRRWNAETVSYLSLGSSLFWGASPYHLAELGLERRVWGGAWATVALNAGMLASDDSQNAFAMPGLSLGLQQTLFGATRVAGTYGYQVRLYGGDRVEPQHQLFILLAQKLRQNVELRARYGYTIATSSAAAYRNGFFSLGLALEL